MLNPMFRSLFAKATFASTPALHYEPWRALEKRVGELQVEDLWFGFMSMAWVER